MRSLLSFILLFSLVTACSKKKTDPVAAKPPQGEEQEVGPVAIAKCDATSSEGENITITFMKDAAGVVKMVGDDEKEVTVDGSAVEFKVDVENDEMLTAKSEEVKSETKAGGLYSQKIVNFKVNKETETGTVFTSSKNFGGSWEGKSESLIGTGEEEKFELYNCGESEQVISADDERDALEASLASKAAAAVAVKKAAIERSQAKMKEAMEESMGKEKYAEATSAAEAGQVDIVELMVNNGMKRVEAGGDPSVAEKTVEQIRQETAAIDTEALQEEIERQKIQNSEWEEERQK